ncbi:3-carboxyethylcatechol 2,3-dioxygenase [Achromobacter denitrificans]
MRAFLGMSHSPLFGLNEVPLEVEKKLRHAIDLARAEVLRFSPDLVVLIGPDHYNGFFNELMPPFCIGTAAQSVGDYGTPAGALNVASELALGLAEHVMDSQFDVAVSRRMDVDHGFSQALQMLWGGLDTPPVIPIFLNAVAQPTIPRMSRCRQLGEAIGQYLDGLDKRVLVIGSGGLSHEPPVPTFKNPDPAIRERITIKRKPSAEEAAAKTQRVMAAGVALASGTSQMKPLNPVWDENWIAALAGDALALDRLCQMPESAIEDEAGLSAHESKTWLVARAALKCDIAPQRHLRHYQAIPEYIAGFGILFLTNFS